MSGIQHEWALNPVTALEFCHSVDGRILLFVGEGVYLKVFEAETSKLLAQCQVFEAQAIHGISTDSEAQSTKGPRLAVWGGRSFILLDSNELESIISCDVTSIISSVQTAPDWILDGAISPLSGNLSCIFITAHSAAIHVKLGHNAQQHQLESLSSPSQSILYAAHVVWTSIDKIMVAAGTVFGEIEVITWDLSGNKDATGSLLFTFTGHEGSIFGVQISPEICGIDGSPTRLLASCSDDRTIRIWDLSRWSNQNKPNLKGAESGELVRETGFGENGNDNCQKSAKRCVAMAMGHASRIWRVKFLTSQVSSVLPTRINVLSFGEDSTCQQWSLDSWTQANTGLERPESPSPRSPSSHPAILRHLDTYAYHSGKHIWSAALTSHRKDGSHLATGGADGKVSIYDIYVKGAESGSALGSTKLIEEVARGSVIADLNGTTMQSWTLEDLLREELVLDVTPEEIIPADELNLQPKKKKKPTKVPKDTLNRYCLVTEDQMLVTTSFGQVMLGSIEKSHPWQDLRLPGHENNDLKSYSIMLGLPVHKSALLAGANGVIYLYRHDVQIMELCRVKGKVAALLDISPAGNHNIQVLVTTLGNEEGQILFIESQSCLAPELRSICKFGLPKNFIVTSAGDVHGQLVLGSRGGMLAVYHHLHEIQQYRMICHHMVQDNDAITSITPVIPSDATESLHFIITSRNGTYSIFSLTSLISGDLADVLPKLVHQATPPLGPMIESAWFEGSDLLLYGFKSTSFIVWNETKQLEVVNVECGGAHRSYTYLPVPGAGGAGHFAYTKASKLCVHSQRKPSHMEVKVGGHGREIKACAVSDSSEHLIATGAEDTTIRIWRERQDTCITQATSLECIAVIQKHSAGIQHLEWSPVLNSHLNYLFSVGGNEEFYVWRITSIPGFGLGVVCEASLIDYSLERDLRIMSIDVRASRTEDLVNRRTGELLPEVAFNLSLVYSDSTLKQYNYSTKSGFKKTAQGRYTSACLTQITTPTSDKNLITAATDGHIAIWSYQNSALDNTEDLQPLSRVKIHQSAILSLDTQRVSPDTFILATGGDDNGLAFTTFTNWKVTKRILIPSAHAAAITGVGFMKMSLGSKVLKLWTIGGDQRVKRWAIDVDLGTKDIRIREVTGGDNVWSSIPDAGGLVRMHRREPNYERCLVWGNGLEIVKIAEVELR